MSQGERCSPWLILPVVRTYIIMYPSTWSSTPYFGYSPFNAWANINAAHAIFVRDGYSWREWQCQA